MVEIRQLVRLFTFSYLSFLPNLLGFWILPILPEVIENNLQIKDKAQLSTVAGFFLGYFYYGIIFGSFFWPYALRVLSKRTALFIGIGLQGLFNALAGQTLSIGLIYFYRFAGGFCHNVNSVGKDFVFDFAKPEYRQYAYSLKTVFTYLASFVGPIFGYYLYLFSGRSFALSMLYISTFYLLGLALFVAVFYVDYSPKDIDGRAASESLDEERVALTDEEGQEVRPTEDAKQRGMWEVLWVCLGREDLRRLILVYFLTNGVYKASNITAIFLLETPWASQGFGISAQTVSLIALFAFVPAVLVVLVSPLYVPSRLSYKAFIQLFVAAMAVLLVALPLLRDLLPERGHERFLWVAYAVQAFLYLSAPKMYSPFINYYLNNNVDSYSRTSLNSLTFLLSNLAGAVVLSIVGPLFSFTLFDPMFRGYEVYTKYVCFVIMSLLLCAALFCLRGYQPNK